MSQSGFVDDVVYIRIFVPSSKISKIVNNYICMSIFLYVKSDKRNEKHGHDQHKHIYIDYMRGVHVFASVCEAFINRCACMIYCRRMKRGYDTWILAEIRGRLSSEISVLRYIEIVPSIYSVILIYLEIDLFRISLDFVDRSYFFWLAPIDNDYFMGVYSKSLKHGFHGFGDSFENFNSLSAALELLEHFMLESVHWGWN